MDTYQTIPNCLEVKDTVSDSPIYISARVVHHRTGIYSSMFGEASTPLNPQLYYSFVEAVASPVKYALFLLVGAALLKCAGLFSPSSNLLIIKLGAFGGAALAFLYLTLLLRCQKTTSAVDSSHHESITACSFSLCKETVYSVFASVVGMWGYGIHKGDEMLFFVLAAAVGPMAFAAIAAASLGIVVGAVWCVERFRDWCAGY